MKSIITHTNHSQTLVIFKSENLSLRKNVAQPSTLLMLLPISYKQKINKINIKQNFKSKSRKKKMSEKPHWYSSCIHHYNRVGAILVQKSPHNDYFVPER